MSAKQVSLISCPFCGAEGAVDDVANRSLSLAGESSGYKVRRCSKCDFRWLFPRPGPDELDALYTSNGYFNHKETGYSYEDQVEQTKCCFTEIASGFSARIPGKGELLDIGCATGDFLTEAQQSGINVTGVEFSPYAVDVCRARGLNVFQGDIFSEKLAENGYAGVHMSHVLEHLEDPVASIRRVHDLLVAGGIFYVEVPYQFDSMLDRYNRTFGATPEFGPFSLHHMTFFSPSSLKRLLVENGFEILSIRTFRSCKRAGRKRSLKWLLLQFMLWVADRVAKKGDVISIWAKPV